MTCRLDALVVDAHDPAALAAFWGAVLGREVADATDGSVLLPGDAPSLCLRFVPGAEPKQGLSRLHLDLTSRSLEDQQRTVARALELGARHLDVGQLPEDEHVVLADPEDNEFCVIEAGNRFLEGCGVIGALACDGTQAVGCFWSAALDWPLVWDQDGETAIQSPDGGPKLTWGGPPVRPKTGRNRMHLDLAPPAGGSQSAEVERLLSLGASRTGLDTGGTDRVVLLDPDGNELCVLPAP